MPTVCTYTLVLQPNPPSITFDPHRDSIHPNVSNRPSDPEYPSHLPLFSPACSDCLRRTKPFLVIPESHSPSLTDGVIYCHDSQSSKPNHASFSRIVFTVSFFSLTHCILDPPQRLQPSAAAQAPSILPFLPIQHLLQNCTMCRFLVCSPRSDRVLDVEENGDNS